MAHWVSEPCQVRRKGPKRIESRANHLRRTLKFTGVYFTGKKNRQISMKVLTNALKSNIPHNKRMPTTSIPYPRSIAVESRALSRPKRSSTARPTTRGVETNCRADTLKQGFLFRRGDWGQDRCRHRLLRLRLPPPAAWTPVKSHSTPPLH